MHPKDKVHGEQKKDLVYHWECQADGVSLPTLGRHPELLERKSKNTVSLLHPAIHTHYTDFHHPLPGIKDFK